jgi:hypothetical protein
LNKLTPKPRRFIYDEVAHKEGPVSWSWIFQAPEVEAMACILLVNYNSIRLKKTWAPITTSDHKTNTLRFEFRRLATTL